MNDGQNTGQDIGTVFEQDFNAVLEELNKAINPSDDLTKGGSMGAYSSKADNKKGMTKDKNMKKMADGSHDNMGDNNSEDDEDDEDKDMGKAMAEAMAQDVYESMLNDSESAAAMDVEPFLIQIVKSVGEAMGYNMGKMREDIRRVEQLAKSLGRAVQVIATLEKSTHGIVEAIGNSPMPGSGSQILSKSSRFPTAEGMAQYTNPEILQKSTIASQKGLLDPLEATKVVNRVNGGILGAQNDALDQKMAAIMRREDI